MLFRCAILVCVAGCAVESQTLVDLRTKSKSVDFSAASTTKPMSTGSALPAACSEGQAYFLTNAPAGSNFYLCSSQNFWTLHLDTPDPTGPRGSTGPSGPAGATGANGANGAIAHIEN